MSIFGDYREVVRPVLHDADACLRRAEELLDRKILNGRWRDTAERIAALKRWISDQGLGGLRVESGAVVAGAAADAALCTEVRSLIDRLVPWRKGPFVLCGADIDAEWRSDMKWNRVARALDQRFGSAEAAIRQKRILDIGCNNGYYLFRLLEHRPELALGIDPVERCLLQFALVLAAAGPAPAAVLPLGVEDSGFLKSCFDLVLCLGVTYHRRDPVMAIKNILTSVKDGGCAVIESLVIPGEEIGSLAPEGRYAKMKNVYQIPTAKQLAVWLESAGFRQIELHGVELTTEAEQRSTRLSPGESLKNFVDFNTAPPLTVEGLPAPRRALFTAVK